MNGITSEKIVVDSSRWACNIHSSGDCYMTIIENIQYHIVPLSKNNFSRYGVEKYNKPPQYLLNIANGSRQEYWEPLTTAGQPIMVCAFDRCIHKYNREFVQLLFKEIFVKLVRDKEYFIKYTKPIDMVHKHVVTNSLGNIALCNKHLLAKRRDESNATSSKRSSDFLTTFKRANKYISTNWEKKIYQALYPTNDERVPMDTRMWVNQAFKTISVKQKRLQKSGSSKHQNNTNQNTQ